MLMTGADSRFRFYDFFAGAGLATLGLRNLWQCVWANDVAPGKAAVYTANFGEDHFVLGDVAQITADQLPKPAQMAWASFPCQDLSLAGAKGFPRNAAAFSGRSRVLCTTWHCARSAPRSS